MIAITCRSCLTRQPVEPQRAERDGSFFCANDSCQRLLVASRKSRPMVLA